VHFIPDGAKSDSNNGRGLLVLGNKVYYTELSGGCCSTDKIRIAPFNGGAGGADIGSLPNPRPGCGVQDLAYHDGYIYALTGYGTCPPLQVFKRAVAGGPWSAPVTITGAPAVADGFTILVNKKGGEDEEEDDAASVVTFLINEGDEAPGSCTYREFNSTTGAPTGNGFVVSGFRVCGGVDTSDSATKGTHVLYFSVGPVFIENQIHSATLTPSFTLTGPSTTQTPGDSWGAGGNFTMEDISLVHGFAGTPGSEECYEKSVSNLARTFNGLANAASALGYSSVAALQAGIRAFCGPTED
jgi:hypothetical protein